ncbi:MAG: glycosyltransferase [Flavobacteriaceae bacterium]|nr:glycosyltransferase [Flavobacteriaceae bacterium]
MTFAIVTHVEHYTEQDVVSAYGPYVREMNLWLKHVDSVLIVAPLSKKSASQIDLSYSGNIERIYPIPSISLVSVGQFLRTVFMLPVIIWQIFMVMQRADHIHLRCPGNIGLLGCLVQVFFPKKPKTAKYAGNWDPNSKQPLSYRFQKWFLSNTFLTRNMQVLVYGEWPGTSKNIKPFFTATYPESKIPPIGQKDFEPPFNFVFAGSLSPGKRPLYAVQLIERLKLEGYNCQLSVYGDGIKADEIKAYISKNNLNDTVHLHGNQTAEVLEDAFKESHFMLLPSKSEGWPKVVAESMFWGSIPMVTSVSCVPWMLDDGNRGILIEADLDKDVKSIRNILNDIPSLLDMSAAGQRWSHDYTLDSFEREIVKLLK